MGEDRGGRVPLVERERELAVLDEVASAVEGSSAVRLVLVTGDAGVGKTRLAAEMVDRLPGSWVTLRIGGGATEPSWSAPFADLIDHVEADGDPARALARSLGEALVRRRADDPLLLVVEDLQFVDPVTVSALQHLLSILSGEPVLVIATYRIGSQRFGSQHARAVSTLLRHPGATELRVTPMSPAGIAELARALDFDGDPDELFARCAGNPFLAEEFIRVRSTTPVDVGVVVAADIGTLLAPAVELATTLAVAGRPLPLSVVRGLDPDGSAAGELLNRGFAVSDVAALRLRHGLVAKALLSTLSPAERRDRHRSLAEVLSRDPSVSDEDLARHWAESGEPALATPFALRAAERLDGQRFHASAVEMYRIALTGIGPEDLQARVALLQRAVVAATLAGDETQVEEWAGVQRDTSVVAGPAWTAASTWSNPHFQQLARGQSEPAGERQLDEITALSALLVGAQERAAAGEFGAAGAIARKVAPAARALGDRFVESDAWLLVGYTGDLAGAAANFAAVAVAAKADRDLVAATLSLARQTRMQVALGDMAAAVDVARDALSTARRAGGPEFWGNIQAATAYVHAFRGEPDVASRLGDELAMLELPVLAILSHGVAWVSAIERGETAEAIRLRDTMLPLARALGDPYFLVPMLMMAGRTHLLDGEPAAAISLLDEATEAMWSPIYELAADVLHASICAAGELDDRAELGRLRSRANELARLVEGPGIGGLAEMAEGSVRASERDHRGAAESFERAARAFTAAERRPMALDAWCLAGAEHVATAELHGALDPARPAAASAADAAGALIDEFGLARCALALAALRGRIAAIPVPDADPLAGLAERERTMVLLAAAGRSNREIGAELYLAEKTVRNVLTRTFSTLGVTRRTQLAAVVGSAGKGPG